MGFKTSTRACEFYLNLLQMNYKHLIFDFDGVLVESNEIRFNGFRSLFCNYPSYEVEKLIQFSRANGGLSRYKKIRYFFEEILNEPISVDNIQALAKQYSNLVKQKVISAEPVIGSLEFLSSYKDKCDFAIVSGSDQEELREVCQVRRISDYFVEILGSPESKESNLLLLIAKMHWGKESCLFIGDSLNDLDAAQTCGIDFIGRDSGLVNWSTMNNIPIIKDISRLPLYLKEF